jgi:hypothetical protein
MAGSIVHPEVWPPFRYNTEDFMLNPNNLAVGWF